MISRNEIDMGLEVVIFMLGFAARHCLSKIPQKGDANIAESRKDPAHSGAEAEEQSERSEGSIDLGDR